MRVVRLIVGVVALLFTLPVLAAGGLGWWAMQHRSSDGGFHADFYPIDIPAGAAKRVVVVPDVDALLRRDAPLARADRTELSLTVGEGVFVGMATPADMAAYLVGVTHTEISSVTVRQGPLVVRAKAITSAGNAPAPPAAKRFWLRGGTGELRWAPSADRGRQVALIVVAPAGAEPVRLSAALEVGWLNSTTWGLLILGPVLLLVGLTALAWPQRHREIVYVFGDSASRAAAPPPEWPPAAPSAETLADPQPLPRMPIDGMRLHLTQRQRPEAADDLDDAYTDDDYGHDAYRDDAYRDDAYGDDASESSQMRVEGVAQPVADKVESQHA